MQNTLAFSKVVIHEVLQMITKGVFLLQCTKTSQISAHQQWYHSFEIGCKSLYLKFESLRKCRVPTSWMCCGFVHATLQPGCHTYTSLNQLHYECSIYPNSSLFTCRGSKYLVWCNMHKPTIHPIPLQLSKTNCSTRDLCATKISA